MRSSFLVAVLCLPALASADAVEDPPSSCPPGSSPSTAHSGPYCHPTADCASDGECGAGTCTQVMQCVETRDCGGRSLPDSEPCTLEHVVGPCNPDGTCATGTCRTRRVCSGGSGGGGGCGCAVVPRAPSLALGALAAVAIALVSRRRARRA